MKKKGKTLNTPVRPELSAWVSPISEAKYWASRIGQIVSVQAGKLKDPEVTVKFEYTRKGEKVPAELFVFPFSRLKMVKDFKARIAKHQPAKAAPSPYDDQSMFDAEEVPANVSGFMPGDLINLLFDTKSAQGERLNKGIQGKIIETFEHGEHLAVEFPLLSGVQFKKLHFSYVAKAQAEPKTDAANL